MSLIKYFFRIVSPIFLALLLSPIASASDLVNVDWLKQNRLNDNLVIIDLRSQEIYQMGHLPNAINIPYLTFSRVKNQVDGFIETPVVFKSIMENNGIKNNDTILLYSDWSFLESMRIYWVLDFYGHRNLKVLDGGIQAWEQSNEKLFFDEPVNKKSQYVIEINSDIISTKFRTFMASKNANYVIIDGRDKSQYEGKKSLTPRKGHIPNSINIPWVDLVKNRNESDQYDRLKVPSTLNDIKALKERLSVIPKDKKIILYCNGGQESSVLYFSLKELGIKAAVYDGSWFEWSTDNNMPIAVSSRP